MGEGPVWMHPGSGVISASRSGPDPPPASAPSGRPLYHPEGFRTHILLLLLLLLLLQRQREQTPRGADQSHCLSTCAHKNSCSVTWRQGHIKELETPGAPGEEARSSGKPDACRAGWPRHGVRACGVWYACGSPRFHWRLAVLRDLLTPTSEETQKYNVESLRTGSETK